MTAGGELPVSERIRRKFAELTRAERQLASTMLANYPVSGLGSITVLAQAAKVSTPTIVRMAKKLGFSGFQELQTHLRSELEAAISNPIAKHDRWAEDAPDTHMLNRFADAAMDNLRQSLSQIDPSIFDKVVNLMSDPKRRLHVVGGRITHSLADYLFTHMQVMRTDVSLLSAHAGTWPHFVLEMREGDLLCLFDIRRYEHDLERLAQMAKTRKVVIILFTDFWGSPVSSQADYVFNARIEAPSAWDSNVVLMLIVEALIAAVQNRTWAETQTRMQVLEKLFDETRLFRKFT